MSYIDQDKTPSAVAFGLDFETWSSVNLPKHGLDRYVNSPDFQVTLAALSPDVAGLTDCVISFIEPEKDTGMTASEAYSLAKGDFEERMREMFKQTVLHVKQNSPAFTGEHNTVRLYVAAHNADFERAVLKHLDIDLNRMVQSKSFTVSVGGTEATVHMVDTAVLSRIYGGASSLANSSRQWTPATPKDSFGEAEGIRLFAIPHPDFKFQPPSMEAIQVHHHLRYYWKKYEEYCRVDANTSKQMAKHPLLSRISFEEIQFEELTSEMNFTGWPVDVPLVEVMNERYKAELERKHYEFRLAYDPSGDLNLNSSLQLKEWCAARGVMMKSFNKVAVASALKKFSKRLLKKGLTDREIQVHQMLLLKEETGGTALKKLDVILNTVGADGRLRHQYVHGGAGQTYRTSGRGVQMQNLKRLGALEIKDIGDLHDREREFSLPELGENVRQLFGSPADQYKDIIVGDFSSVESRALAMVAGATWKVDAFKAGKDMYKVAAENIFNIPYDDVDKGQRNIGKVAELACGYQGGPEGAVARFLDIYGIDMEEADRVKLVLDWRASNPEIVNFWNALEAGFKRALTEPWNSAEVWNDFKIPNTKLVVRFQHVPAPESVDKFMLGTRTILMQLHYGQDDLIFERAFVGAHMYGDEIRILKPSENKTGPVWTTVFRDPDSGKFLPYTMYGGKLTGIFIQSFCRQLFFHGLQSLHASIDRSMAPTGLKIVGQFHDELDVEADYNESTRTREGLEQLVAQSMAQLPYWAKGMPLEADIGTHHRYVK